MDRRSSLQLDYSRNHLECRTIDYDLFLDRGDRQLSLLADAMTYRIEYRQVVDDFKAGRLTVNEAFERLRGIAKEFRREDGKPDYDISHAASVAMMEIEEIA